MFSYPGQPGVSGSDQENGKQDNINPGFQIWHSDIFSEEREFNNKPQRMNSKCGALEREAVVESLPVACGLSLWKFSAHALLKIPYHHM